MLNPLTHGPHAGRLIIPENHTELTDTGKIISRAHIIYSDNHGRTWKLGGSDEEMLARPQPTCAKRVY